ncbi:MAG TPA: pirin family protein [Microbacteriaceae bacterium]|nr:pirin family protein [Microbacteriaceae bacterium]
MSNAESTPEAIAGPAASESRSAILRPRAVPLGGLRAMTVWRTLPQSGRTTIGAWCFIDHYRHDTPVDPTMVVAPHPHTGLQTVSWLFRGEIEHRDSVGSRAIVRPGDMNLMTAGRGIQHSEVATERSEPLHGVQLWTVLPDEHRDIEPFFEQVPTSAIGVGAAQVRTFLGSFAGSSARASTFWEFFGAEVTLPAGAHCTLPVGANHEHGVLIDTGALTIDDGRTRLDLEERELGYLEPGSEHLSLIAGDAPVRAIVLGGVPFPEPIVMWWNFIGRDADDIVRAREDWQREVIAGESPRGRFGTIDGDLAPLPAPGLPTVTLKPRRSR